MQDLSPFLDQALIFFAYTTTVVVVVVSVFLIKLLIELSELAKISQKVAYMLKNEFEPTVIELQKALKTINSVCLSYIPPNTYIILFLVLLCIH